MRLSRFRWIMGGALALALSPMLSVLTAAGLAALGGCALHEGFANACALAGVEIGGALYAMAVFGWLGLVTAPIAAFGALIWIVAELVARRRRRLGGCVPDGGSEGPSDGAADR